MGILAVDSIRSRTVAPVTVSDDLNVTGVSTVGVLTATSVVVGSAVTANADGVITSGIVTATTFQGNFNGTTGTFSGDVSIGGTLTYEDVERVDATGLSTFREGLNVGSPTGVGGTFNPQGDISAGIGSFSGAISGGAISGTTGTYTGQVNIGVNAAASTSTPLLLQNSAAAGDGSSPDLVALSFGSSGASKASIRAAVYGEGWMSFHNNNDSEKVRITAGGSVGIGTTIPDDTLTVRGSNGSGLRVGDGTANVLLGTGAGPVGRLYTISNHDLIFGTNDSERLRVTKTGGFSLNNGELVERCYINSTAWSTTGTVNLDNGMVQYNSSNLAGTNNTLDIISSVGINTTMATGDMMSVTCITAVNASTAYVNNITIDGIAATETWVGGSAPTDGGTAGVDIYAFNIVKTADATFLVVANQSKTS